MLSPYATATFFSFFPIFFSRMGQLLTGQIAFSSLYSDEIQILLLSCLALSTTTVGLLLVLRKNTMLANALSHTVLIGIVLAFFVLAPFFYQGAFFSGGVFPTPLLLLAALITAFLTTGLSELIHHTFRVQQDASVGLVFTTLFALGIAAVTLLAKNTHIGTEAIMGNIDALQIDDIPLVAFVGIGNLLLLFAFYKEWLVSTFDERYAWAQGLRPRLFHYLLMVQASVTIISGFRAVGVLLILAFLTAPILTARLFFHRFRSIWFASLAFSLLAILCGVAFARHLLNVHNLPLSTGGLTVSVLGFSFAVAATAALASNRRKEYSRIENLT